MGTLLALSLAFGCTAEMSRSTMGGMVYGSLVGTSIAPGIGSAIGAGVGMVAGALEGAQRQQELEEKEELYRQTFYRLRQEALEASSQPTRQQGRTTFQNLLALQESTAIGEEIHEQQEIASPEPEGGGAGQEAGSSQPQTEAVRLYRELSALRRQNQLLEARVSHLETLLEEYERSGGQASGALLSRMREALGLPVEESEILYLQREYIEAKRLKNEPLAEAVSRRMEELTGSRPEEPATSFIP
jgi:hypothetical protein